MRQRGAIARALSVGADALLLDEPFGALDPVNRASLQDLVLELCRGVKDRPITTLFVTHDIREAVYLGSRIIVLGSTPGRIIADIPLNFPVRKNRSDWFRDEKVQQTIVAIEEACQDGLLAHSSSGSCLCCWPPRIPYAYHGRRAYSSGLSGHSPYWRNAQGRDCTYQV